MTLIELCNEEARKFGFDDKTLDEANLFADIATAPEGGKEKCSRELTEEEINTWRNYINEVLTNALNDPEYREEFMRFCKEQFGF